MMPMLIAGGLCLLATVLTALVKPIRPAEKPAEKPAE